MAYRNHVKKNLSKKLYTLKTKYKDLNKKGLISHIKKCFSHAVAQNEGNAVRFSAAVRCISDHMYNARGNCGTWQCSQNVDVNGPHHRCFELIVSSSFNQPMTVERGRSHELVGSMVKGVYDYVLRTLVLGVKKNQTRYPVYTSKNLF